VGPVGKEEDAGPGTDFHAINNKAVSITPIHVDLTQYKAIDTVASWLQGE
jgi:5'-nucleotidase